MSLRLEGFSAGYGRDAIVHDISLPVPDGTISVLIGPNGAGKSTVLKALFGSAVIVRGSVYIDDVLCRDVTPMTLLKQGIAYVPQLRNVFPHLTVLENLDMGLGGARPESVERVIALFPDLKQALGKEAGKLSGGQRNMVALGRALMGEPRTLLIDEGGAGLAPRAVEGYWTHLNLLATAGVGILVVEQDVLTALRRATRAFLLRGGEIVISGSGEELLERTDLGALFLGAREQ